jgi:hypothetical protein
MFIVLLFLGILGYIVIKGRPGAHNLKRCPKLHKWVIRFDNDDKRGYLVCKECGQIPGEE